MTSAPVLVWPDFAKPFYIETDASDYGIGAQLLQRQGETELDVETNLILDTETPLLKQADFKPIAFISKALNKHERNYGASHKEALAVVFACKQFENYCYRRPVYIITDCIALKYMLKSKDLSGKLARWALAIQALNPLIIYWQGRINEMADGLSRTPFSEFEQRAAEAFPIDEEEEEELRAASKLLPESTVHLIYQINTISFDLLGTNPETTKTIIESQKRDKFLSEIFNFLENRELPTDKIRNQLISKMGHKYEVWDGIIWFSGMKNDDPRIAVPQHETERLVYEAHNTALSGHPGPRRTWQKLYVRYHWPGMKRQVYDHCKKCEICAERRGQCRRFSVPQSHVPCPHEPMHTVAIDVHTVGKAKSGNQHTILAYDLFSKDVVGTAVPDQKATTLAYALINHVFCRVGPAKVILSDLGQNLLSAVFKEMCKFFGIKRIYMTAY
ncbi:MAG: DDE-type integrase/transposase/recombinase, partial [Pseudoalteromonas sp.]|nr:DDE-type integrase/transposase/recombinase [Pseudoalteromonas sp.]